MLSANFVIRRLGISIVPPGLLMPPKKKARVDEDDNEKGNKLRDGVRVGILAFER